MKGNILFNALSVLVSGLVFFLTYKYAIAKIGISQLGVWSLVVALASFSKIIENGIAISTLRMTAEFSECKYKVEEILINSLIVGGLGVFLFNIFLYILIINLVPVFYNNEVTSLVLIILIPVLVFGCINSLSMIFLSVMEGLKNVRLKLTTTAISGLFFLMIVGPAIDSFGIQGIVYAQIIQSVFMCSMLYILLFLHAKIKLSFAKIEYSTMKNIINFSRSTQVTTLTHLLSEPTTKMLLTYFGGSSAVALFDMALKLVNQVRLIVVAANQAIIPYATKIFINSNHKEIKNYYSSNLKFIYYAACLIYFPLIILASEISYFWLGIENLHFIKFLIILSVVNWINIFTVPGYYMSISGDVMKWNTLGHLIFCVLNFIFGIALGYLIDNDGVFYGYIIALAISSVIMLSFYNEQFEFNWSEFFKLLELKVFLPIFISTVGVLVFNSKSTYASNYILELIILKFLIIFIIFIVILLEFKKIHTKKLKVNI